MENTKLRESKYDLNMKLRHSKIQKLIFISNKFVSIIADAEKAKIAVPDGHCTLTC